MFLVIGSNMFLFFVQYQTILSLTNRLTIVLVHSLQILHISIVYADCSLQKLQKQCFNRYFFHCSTEKKNQRYKTLSGRKTKGDLFLSQNWNNISIFFSSRGRFWSKWFLGFFSVWIMARKHKLHLLITSLDNIYLLDLLSASSST